jgi:hypothetical protein
MGLGDDHFTTVFSGGRAMSGVPSWAVRGAKVVCVDACPWVFGWSGDALVEGAIYTIRGIAPHDSLGRLGLYLDEARTKTDAFGFLIARFRPLVDDSDEALARDVALFTEHLRQPSTTREGADA